MKKEKIVSHSKYVVKDEKKDKMMAKKMDSAKKPMDIGDALMKAKKSDKKLPKVKPSTKKKP